LIWLYQFFGNHLHDLSFPDKRDLSDADIMSYRPDSFAMSCKGRQRMKMINDRMSMPYFALGVLALAMGIIPLNDALIKLMSGDVSLGQLVALRAGMTLIMLGIFSRSIQAMFALPAKVFWLFFALSLIHI